MTNTAPDTPPKKHRPTILKRLRTYFLAGVLVSAPLFITGYLAWLTFNFIDDRVLPLIPEKYNPESYLPFAVPGLGLVFLLVGLTLVGMLTTGFIGRVIIRYGERLLNRMPIIRGVYGALKQVFETLMTEQSRAFREAVLVEYPRCGIWAVGFVTGVTEGEFREIVGKESVNIFVPTTPNPTSGFMLMVPKDSIFYLHMSVEEAMKMVISGGIVTPPDNRTKAEQSPPELSSNAQ